MKLEESILLKYDQTKKYISIEIQKMAKGNKRGTEIQEIAFVKNRSGIGIISLVK